MLLKVLTKTGEEKKVEPTSAVNITAQDLDDNPLITIQFTVPYNSSIVTDLGNAKEINLLMS